MSNKKEKKGPIYNRSGKYKHSMSIYVPRKYNPWILEALDVVSRFIFSNPKENRAGYIWKLVETDLERMGILKDGMPNVEALEAMKKSLAKGPDAEETKTAAKIDVEEVKKLQKSHGNTAILDAIISALEKMDYMGARRLWAKNKLATSEQDPNLYTKLDALIEGRAQ